ncbi:MAG: hypothetical protein HKN91_00520 [Acidimicrobiia bacterium]|nr:hypothetical protein [Acidimicrobiia bacterium]
MRSARPVVLAAVFLLVLPLAGTASAVNEGVQTITSTDGVEGDYFGLAIDVHEDKMIVGAHRKQSESGVGGAYVFRRQGGNWAEEQALEPDVATRLSARRVAIGEDIALVSAVPADSTQVPQGVFVFEHDGTSWVQTATLHAEDPVEFTAFGSSLAVAGSMLVVGATHDSHAGEYAGAVYIFEMVDGEWQQIQRVVAWDAAPHDGFGHDVAATSDLIMVGAPWGDSEGPYTGGIYAFEHGANGWHQIDKFKPDDAAGWQSFGQEFELNGTTVAAGVRSDDDARGAVYIFEQNGDDWIQAQKIQPEEADSGFVFGASVALEGDMLLVGADGPGHVFRRAPNDFELVEYLMPLGTGTLKEFAVWRGDALVGVPGDFAGAVVHFDISADPSWPCTITGTSGNDHLVGTGGDDVICGYGGDDHIYGRAGDDVLKGGDGDDKLYAGYGFDFLFGHAGDDRLVGGAQGDLMRGGPGDDVLRGKGGHDWLEGNTGQDALFGAAGNDVLLGGNGVDDCDGGLGVNSFAGCED